MEKRRVEGQGRGVLMRTTDTNLLLHVGGWLDERVKEETKKHLLPLSTTKTCWCWSSLFTGNELADSSSCSTSLTC